MARLYTVDLGAWSVKVVVATQGLRSMVLNHVIERLVPPGEGSVESRALPVLAEIIRSYNLGSDASYWGVYGDHVFTNVLDFDFKNLRKADMDKAVGGELEGLVPLDLEDMVYASDILPMIAAPPVVEGAEARGRSAAPTLGSRVLTYAMSRERAESLITQGRSIGAEPKGLLPVGAAAARLLDKVPSAKSPIGATAVIDIGHERSDIVVVVGGKPVFSRTVGRAGKQITAAIAQHWKMSVDQAESAKHSDGFIASSMEPATSEAWDKIHQVIAPVLLPFARDVRQTIASCRAKTGAQVGGILLVGGGARLRGLASFLTEHVGVPCQILSADHIALIAGKLDDRTSIDSAALAIGMALDAGTGRPQFDLRSGALASKMDLSYLRTKAAPILAGVVAIAACAAGAAYADYYRLKKAGDTLSVRVAKESAEQFGGTAKTAAAILKSSKPDQASMAESPLPKLTAYDILLDINARIPAKDKITLNISKLDIGKDKIDIAATAQKSEEIDLLVTALQEIKCFGEIGRGPTESGDNGVKKFTLTIPSTCM
jgi:general secretion pathway protein L